jgi:hypothetical protein
MRRRAGFGCHDHEPPITVADENVPVQNELADDRMLEDLRAACRCRYVVAGPPATEIGIV